MKGGCTLKDIGNTFIKMAKIQKQRTKAVKKTHWEILREGFLERAKSQKQSKFTRIPMEVPTILSSWEQAGKVGETVGNACRFANAAA